MSRQALQLLASGTLLLSGCMAASEADAVQVGLADTAVQAVADAPITLRAGASVGDDEIDGYSQDGIGIYLSADGTKAMLTVYVLTPAERAVFVHPTLHLTTQKDDRQWIQDRQFETVTLTAGQSRTLEQEADGALMDVEAEVSALQQQSI